MKFALWIMGIFIIAVFVGLAVALNNGYVIFLVSERQVVVSLNFFIVLAIVFVVAIHWIWRLINFTSDLPKQARRFQEEKQLKSASHMLREAGIAFFEGRYQQAEREARRSLETPSTIENQGLAMLIAAQSSNATGDTKKANDYLERLTDLPKRLQLAKYIVDAEMKLHAKDISGALQALTQAKAISPNLTQALKLELKARLLQKQPFAILDITQKLLKAEAIAPEQARQYRLAAYQQQLSGLISQQEIQAWLKRIPEAELQHPLLLNSIIFKLIDLKQYDYAATLLVSAIDGNHYDMSELSRALSKIAGHLGPEKRLELLKIAEKWLIHHPEDYVLLFALGRLALEQQLWGKAQSYLEASLSIRPTLSAHAELARLFERTGKTDWADKHYHQSLKLALEQGL